MAQKILVIGGVALGPKAACRCKRLMPDAEITLVDENLFISYGGVPASPYYCVRRRSTTSTTCAPRPTTPCVTPNSSVP